MRTATSVPERTNLQVMPEWVCVCALDGSKAICPYDSLISCGDELLTAVFFSPHPRQRMHLFDSHHKLRFVHIRLFKDTCRHLLSVFVVGITNHKIIRLLNKKLKTTYLLWGFTLQLQLRSDSEYVLLGVLLCGC